MKLHLVVPLLIVVTLLSAACAPVTRPLDAASDAGAIRSIILTAFGDSAGAFGETQPFLQAQQVTWPAMGADVQAKVEHFFTADQVRPVRVFDYTQCGEVAGNNFWHGAVESKLARKYLAGLITAAGFAQVEEDAVMTFSAMEASAWMSVLARWNAHHDVSILMAVIRGASNYDQMALDASGNPVMGEDGQPLTAMADILENFKEAGASFAWGNAAQPVLKLFELRRGQ
jgi:hypothetical protein